MRGRILFLLILLLLVAAVPVLYYLLFEYNLSVSRVTAGKPLPPSRLRLAVEPSETVPALALSLIQVTGPVEVRRGEGVWQPAEEGMVLEAEDRVRTGTEGSALLSIPGSFSVALESDSNFTVKALAEHISRFRLEDGMVSASVVDNPRALFEVSASSATARSRGGDFRLAVNPRGLVALGASRGSVELAAEGKVVQVDAGYQARVEKGKPPEDPIRIPRKLLLRVRWPRERDLAMARMTVVGQTDPAARVRIEGQRVEVDDRGRFTHVLSLKEGRNRIRVESWDVGGNRQISESPVFQVDTRPEAFQIHTDPGMWRKKDKDPAQRPDSP
ncbi:MAG: FecR domain-containing protein [Myxococcales bacterium]|nr:FecR domain-containing protein [Myxococcales bacterium]